MSSGDVQYNRLEADPKQKCKEWAVRGILIAGACGVLGLIILTAYEFNHISIPTAVECLQKGFENIPLNRKPVVQNGLDVDGSIPDWLKGSLYRNGPAYYKSQDAHWFDGLAMLHKFEIANGGVNYRSDWIRSTEFNNSLTGSNGSYSPNTLVTLYKIAGHYLTYTAYLSPNEFDPATLNTIAAPFKYNDDMPEDLPNLGPEHGVIDPKDGTFIHLRSYGGQPAFYQLYTVSPAAATRVSAPSKIDLSDSPAKRPLYMHSFAITENFVVLTENPVVPNGANFGEYEFHPEWNTLFRIVDRKSGEQVASFEAEPFFAFHHVNAFEDGNGTIIVDLLRYDDVKILKAFYLNVLLNSTLNKESMEAISSVQLWRYTMSLKDAPEGQPGKAQGERINTKPFELPQINQKYTGKAYRYLYGVAVNDKSESAFFDSLIKVDLQTGATKTWHETPRHFPSEPIFVPKPDAKDEDDGVLLSVVLDGRKGRSYLLVLDAKDFEELGKAALDDVIVPLGFHGGWY